MGATLTHLKYWDHEQNEEGCHCVDEPTDTMVPVLEGIAAPIGGHSFLVEEEC